MDDINKFYYENTDFHNMSYLGIQTLKNPADLWVYQEILFETKPELIIECGTHLGGTTLYLAHLLRHINSDSHIISIDIESNHCRIHPRIEYLIGDSVSAEVFEKVLKQRNKVDTCLVILDSDHSEAHVSKELQLYSSLVSRYSYIIVEDTNLNGHPVHPEYGPGPWEAVEKFLASTNEFIVDRSREHYLITFNPNGYLRRVR